MTTTAVTTSDPPPKWRRWLQSGGLAVLVLAAGGGTLAALMATAPAPDRDDGPAPPRVVRAFVAEPGTHVVAVTSYGQSQAADDWTAKAEVEGNIESLYDEFDDGHVVPQDTVLATIDDREYQLAVQRAEAEQRSQEQQLAELAQRERNANDLLKLRREQLQFAELDLERSRRQRASEIISAATLEKAESAHVDRLTAVTELENELELIPIQQKIRTAALEIAKFQVELAGRDVERCTIKMPFTGLCIGKEIEAHEKVERGQTLGSFIALDRAEVLAMVEPRKALMLFPRASSEFYGSIDLTSEAFNSEMRRRLQKFLVRADVTWRVGNRQSQWRGRATRVSAIVDERSRTAPAVIEIEDAFTDIRPGVRPALVPGMFLEVTLYGDRLEDVFVIPRDALREGHVYIEKGGELVIRPVNVLALEEELAVIDKGLAKGDRVVVTDLFPAANGMRIKGQVVDNPVRHRGDLPELRNDVVGSDNAGSDDE